MRYEQEEGEGEEWKTEGEGKASNRGGSSTARAVTHSGRWEGANIGASS